MLSSPRGIQLKGGFRAALFFSPASPMRWRMIDMLIVGAALLVVAGLYWLATHQEVGPKAPHSLTTRPD